MLDIAVVAQPGRALDLIYLGVKLKTELSWAQISPTAHRFFLREIVKNILIITIID